MTAYNATGNTFLILWEEDLPWVRSKAQFVKERVGNLDGLIFARNAPSGFSMDYFNRDGSSAPMCGNGARVFVRFLFDQRLVSAGQTVPFQTGSGPLEGRVLHDERIQVQMPTAIVHGPLIVQNLNGLAITVGVPHFVVEQEEIENIDVEEIGSSVCRDPSFPQGSNVSFFRKTGPKSLAVRTFERGVERETGACGTGVCACVWSAYSFSVPNASSKSAIDEEFSVTVRGGLLWVRLREHRLHLAGYVEPLADQAIDPNRRFSFSTREEPCSKQKKDL